MPLNMKTSIFLLLQTRKMDVMDYMDYMDDMDIAHPNLSI